MLKEISLDRGHTWAVLVLMMKEVSLDQGQAWAVFDFYVPDLLFII